LGDFISIEFLFEIEKEFHDFYPRRIHSSSDYILIPVPYQGEVLCLTDDLELKGRNFFYGDQKEPRPYIFDEPVAISSASASGYYICDMSIPNILFFNEAGEFQYSKSPPGLLEYTYDQPVNIATDGVNLAVLEADMNLYCIDAFGKRKTLFFKPLMDTGQMKIRGLSYFKEKIFMISHNTGLLSLEPLTGSIEFIELPAEKLHGKLESFCFDFEGRLYLITTEPASLVVIDSDRVSILATYEYFGYKAGDLRYPKCIDVNNKGIIYIIDDNRVMKLRLIFSPDTRGNN